MTIDRRTGECEDTPEQDAARRTAAEVGVYRLTVTQLLATNAANFPGSLEFLMRMDLHVNVLNRMPTRDDIKRLKDLAWKYRREMQSPIAPKLPPHDPLVQSIEGEA